MIIRKERESDIEAIYNVTKLAFANHPYSENTEQFIINALRSGGALTISLVAEIDGKIAGHIAFSPVTFSDGSERWYGLGPIAVLPDYQKQGIGTRLVNEGLGMLKGMGGEGCVTVGEPEYYERFGFRSPRGLKHEGVPQENFLALSFCNRIPEGTVQFHSVFGATK